MLSTKQIGLEYCIFKDLDKEPLWDSHESVNINVWKTSI